MQMNEEMGGGSDVVLLDNKANRQDQDQFWQALGGKGLVSASDEQSDALAAEDLTLQTKLFKFMEDEGGRLDVSFRCPLSFLSVYFILMGIDCDMVWRGTVQGHA